MRLMTRLAVSVFARSGRKNCRMKLASSKRFRPVPCAQTIPLWLSKFWILVATQDTTQSYSGLSHLKVIGFLTVTSTSLSHIVLRSLDKFVAFHIRFFAPSKCEVKFASYILGAWAFL